MQPVPGQVKGHAIGRTPGHRWQFTKYKGAAKNDRTTKLAAFADDGKRDWILCDGSTTKSNNPDSGSHPPT